MKKKIFKALQWIALSSKDPRKVSLTVKGILTTTVTYAGLASGLFHFGFPMEQAQGVVENTTKAVEVLFTFISYGLATYAAWGTVWGTVRKFYTTIVGTNKVINEVA